MSEFLFAEPGYISGIGRTFDLAGQFDDYNDSPDEATADAIATFADWRSVGDGLWAALKSFHLDEPTPAAEK